METKLEVINEQEVLGKQFRVFGTLEQPLFLAKDVAEWIEHSKVSMMLQSVDDDEKVKVSNVYFDQGRTGGAGTWFLTEDGLYEVLMQSRKPIAKQFKKKVKEILKEIRMTGKYVATTVDSYMIEDPIERAQRWIEEQKAAREKVLQLEAANKEKDEQIAVIQPKADYVEDVLKTTSGTFPLTNLCTYYGEGILKSARKLNEFLEADGVIHGKQHRPDQRFIDARIFSYQIPEYGPDYTGFRSRKLELRLRPEGFEKLAKEYIPVCIEYIRTEKELERARKNREKAVKKAAGSEKAIEAGQELIRVMGQLRDIQEERRNAIWNMLNEEPVRLIG